MNDLPSLLAQALALEEEAMERYAELAEIMAAHNNPEAERLFRRMADIEKLHVAEIRTQIERQGLGDLPAADCRWVGGEGPETTDYADLHYLMTPRQALTLALVNERRARDYYLDIAEHASSPEVMKLAGELAREERDHVKWVEAWLDRFPEPEEGWDRDDDPPNLQA